MSVLSVTLVYCGQTVRCIKMKLDTEVGLGPGHVVLDGDPAPTPKGHSPQSWHMSVVAKRLDGSSCHLVRRQASAQATLLDGDPALPQNRGHSSPPPLFGPFIVAKRLDGSRCHMVQRYTLAQATLLHGDLHPQKGGIAAPNFRSVSVVAKQLDGSRCYLVWR